MVINLSLEEYYRMKDNGTLESYLISNGILFKDALLHVLSLQNERIDELECEVSRLEEELDELTD